MDQNMKYGDVLNESNISLYKVCNKLPLQRQLQHYLNLLGLNQINQLFCHINLNINHLLWLTIGHLLIDYLLVSLYEMIK